MSNQPYRCANCDFTAPHDELPPAKDVSMRVEPGEPYTDVECPECGALCVPVEEPATPKDYEEVLADHRRLVRELDVLINGEEGAATQASLVDIVAQVRKQGLVIKQASVPTVTAFSPSDFIAILEAARVALKDERMAVKIADSVDESDRRIAELRDRLEAAMQSDVPLFSPGVQHVVDLFMDAYEKWNAREEGGEDDLHYAAKMARNEVVRTVTSATRAKETALVTNTLKGCLGYLETPGDFSPEEVGHLQEDVEQSLRRLCPSYFDGDEDGGSGPYIVCEVICQKPAVSLHDTEEEALDHAAQCALENLKDPDDDEDNEVTRAGFRDQLTEDDRICEGDYEIYILTPTNRPR